MGVDFTSTPVVISTSIKVQIYDLAGKESDRITTLEWLREAQSNPVMLFVLVGNKTDLQENRVISQNEAEMFSERHGLLYTETSAKTRMNVGKCFEDLTVRVLQNVYDLGRHSGVKRVLSQ